jgi:hypothetical protein
MRYYAIKITPGAGVGLPPAFGAMPGAAVNGAQFCSVVNGKNDPGALNIEFDVTVTDGAVVAGFLRVWGIPFEMIAQAAKLTGCNVELYGGFTNGLPLATAEMPHQGLLFKGMIWPAFGNWQMTDMTLDMTIQACTDGGTGSASIPKNIVHNMAPNTPLSQAIKSTLSTAFPGKKINVNISDRLKLAYQDAGFYQSLGQYSSYMRQLSLDIINGPQKANQTNPQSNYKGISIVPDGDTINVSDDTKSSTNIKISYIDLVGQPTWIAHNTISIKVVNRADIKPTNHVTLPPTLVTTTGAGAFTAANGGAGDVGTGAGPVSFQGDFLISQVRHVGNFRQPSGDAWVTILTGVSQESDQAGSGTTGGSKGTQGDQQAAAAPDGSVPPGNSSSIGPGNFNDPSTFVPAVATQSYDFVPNPNLGGRH